MKRFKTLALSILATGVISTQAYAESFVIDNKGAHASVQFKASHLGYSYVVGRFNEFEGSFSYDEADPSAGSVKVTIDASSLDSNHAERDKHLKGGDFLEVSTYPTITFNSTAVSESEENISITGDLQMHGVSKSVTLDAVHVGNGDDPWGGYRRGLEATVTLAPEDFGLPKWVGPLQISLIAEGIRQ
jgi:polyisoprenoid-binding protein YceI